MQDLEKLTLKTRRREFEDGLFDLSLALILFIVTLPAALLFSSSGLYWYVERIIRQREQTLVLIGAIYLLMLAIPFILRMSINHIRKRTFWKESGYTRPLPLHVSWRVMLSLTMGSIFLISFAAFGWARGVLTDEHVLKILPGVTGVATGLLMMAMGRSLAIARYLWAGGTGALLSVIVVFLPDSPGLAWFFFGVIWLLLMTISGLSALIPAWRRRVGEEY